MSDRDPTRPAASDETEPSVPPPARAARPGAPDVRRRRSAAARPGRPDGRPTPARTDPAPPPVAETTIVALPPPAPRRPSPFATRSLRAMLFPPALVSGVGFVAIGTAYFAAPADAATRQWPPVVAIAIIGVGLICLAVAGVLAVTLRR